MFQNRLITKISLSKIATMMNETDQISTCCVCYNEYDDNHHKPKYLQCFHTVCIQCLQIIFDRNIIKCPICRQSTPCPEELAHLSNDARALYTAQMKNEMKVLNSKNNSDRRELEDQIITKASNLCQRGVEELIETRRQIQNSLQKTLENLEAVKSELTRQSADNESKINELTRKLEDHKMKKTEPQDFKSVDNGCLLLLEESSQDLKSIMNMTTTLNWEKMVQIKIKMKSLKDQPISSNALDEFSVLQTSNDPKKSLLSHLIFSTIAQNGSTVKIKSDSDLPDDNQSEIGVIVSVYNFRDILRNYLRNEDPHESPSDSNGFSSPILSDSSQIESSTSPDSDWSNYDMVNSSTEDDSTDVIDGDNHNYGDQDDDFYDGEIYD